MSAYGSQSYPAPESYRDSGEGWGDHATYPQSYDEHLAYPQPYGEEYATYSQTHGEEQAASAWAIQSDDEEDEAEIDSDEDWDVYRDFNNMSQSQKPEGMAVVPVPQRDQDSLPSRRTATIGGIPPHHTRRSGPHLVSFQDTSGAYPATFSDKHVHEMQGSTADLSRGYSFANDDSRPFAHDLGDSALELAPLGEEFTSDEHERMTRKNQRQRWKYSQLGAVDSWLKGYKPICGWFGPRAAVAIGFAFVVVLGIALYFVVPRVPSVSLITNQPLKPRDGEGAMNITGFPTGFVMNGTLSMRLDNTDGWIPSHLKSLNAVVKYKPAKTKVGEGKISGNWIAGRKVSSLSVPIYFNYKSLNSTGDETQLAFQGACAHPLCLPANPDLDLTVEITTDIQAVPGTQKSTMDLTSYACPWVLPN